MMKTLHGGLRRLASLRLTLACLALAALIALAGDVGGWPTGTLIAVPFVILFVNLAAAIATHGALRTQAGLFGFHLALACLALLAAIDRLSGLSGHVEVTQGTAFDPTLVEARIGPLHPGGLERVRFVQGRFEIDYAPRLKRRETRSTVYVPDDTGNWHPVIVGDDTPLVVGDYRFYTSFNKGFAPLLSYIAADGTIHSGAVHLPSYPLNFFKQGNVWTIPGTGREVKLWLHVPEPVFVEDAPWRFRIPDDAVLVIMDGAQRYELRPGDTVPLGGGRLRYEELRTWMGYTIDYSPMIPWMLAAAATAALSLAWHAIGKLRRSDWDRATGTEERAHVR